MFTISCIIIVGPYSQHFIFIVTYEWAQKAKVFVHVRPFQPSLMFASRAGAYPSEAPFTGSTLGYSPGLIHKHLTRLGRPTWEKH
jgi:hypothetical protein